MEDEYKNREIDKFITELKEQLNRIEAHCEKTNGRVSKLELWRSGIVACIALIAFIIPIILSYAK